MKDKNVQSILHDALEEDIPSSQINLWPRVKERLVAGRNTSFQQGEKMNPIRSRHRRFAMTALMLIALLVVALRTPQGRAFAQNIVQFFTRAESNTFPLQPSQVATNESDLLSPTSEPPASLMSIADAEMQAGFDAAELPFVPDGFNYLGARLYGNAISIEYEATGGGGHLIIMQSKDGFIQSDWDKVPAEAVIPVQVGQGNGEFVQGTFVVPAGETSATWNLDAPIFRLRWMNNDVWFDMTKFGAVEAIEYLDQNGMIKLAESLTTDPFPLDVKQAEAQAEFEVMTPITLPEGMTFLGSSFDPVLKMVSLSFGYSETDRRILIKQQPINSPETCDLCGVVGASATVESVHIGDLPGEYALGVWELTENGPVWRDDPYLKTIRWQKDSIAYELICMGMEVERDELIAIAASMK